jgi:ribonuclease T1
MTRVWFRRFLLPLLAGAALSAIAPAREPAPPALPEIPVAQLPAEARETLALVQRGGPFPHKKDGSTFGNFEKRLPVRARGYYREYTVPTPGARDRGARRIVAGGGEYYYTDDHYRSFRRIRE